MIASLALPTLILMALAVVVTRLLERVVSETVLGLFMLFALSGVLVWVLASAMFMGLYLWQDASIAPLLGDARGLGHLLVLGAKSALIWGPLLVLTVVTAPRRWRQQTARPLWSRRRWWWGPTSC